MQIHSKLESFSNQTISITNLDSDEKEISASEVVNCIFGGNAESPIDSTHRVSQMNTDCEIRCGGFDVGARRYFFFTEETETNFLMPDLKVRKLVSIFISENWDTIVQYGMTQNARSIWKL